MSAQSDNKESRPAWVLRVREWFASARANPVKEFCDEFCSKAEALQLPSLKPADKEHHLDLQVLIDEANVALKELHDNKSDAEESSKKEELQNKLDIVKAKIAAINAYFARFFGKMNSSIPLSLFEKDQGADFFGRTKKLTEHFSGFVGQVKSAFTSRFSRDETDDSDAAQNTQMLTIKPAFAREASKPIDITRCGLMKAVAAFKVQHGERSVQINFLPNGKFNIRFQPEGSGILHAAYPQYQAYQADFLSLLQAEAKAEAAAVALRGTALDTRQAPASAAVASPSAPALANAPEPDGHSGSDAPKGSGFGALPDNSETPGFRPGGSS